MVILGMVGPADNPSVTAYCAQRTQDDISARAVWFWQVGKYRRLGYRVTYCYEVAARPIVTWFNKMIAQLHFVAILD